MRAGQVVGAVLGGMMAACQAAPAPRVIAREPVREAITLAVYGQTGDAALTVVEQRQWIDVATGDLVLDHIDGRAQLASLTVEVTSGPPLAVAGCGRDFEAAADQAHCTVTGAPGRRLVRVRYVVPGVGYHAAHALTVSGDAARLTTRVRSTYRFPTAAWSRGATLRVFDHAPGAGAAAHELARGAITLDGREAEVATPARPLAGALQWIYAGAAAVTEDADATSPREARWHHTAQNEVWLWLVVSGLVPGDVTAELALDGGSDKSIVIRQADVRDAGAGALRMPLWRDDDLSGERVRTTEQTRAQMIDRFEVTIRNRRPGAPREVWLEEDLRPFPHHIVPPAIHAGVRPVVTGDHLRVPLVVGGGDRAAARFAIEYELLP